MFAEKTLFVFKVYFICFIHVSSVFRPNGVQLPKHGLKQRCFSMTLKRLFLLLDMYRDNLLSLPKMHSVNNLRVVTFSGLTKFLAEAAENLWSGRSA